MAERAVGEMVEIQTLLRAAKDGMLWKAITVHALKGYDTEEEDQFNYKLYFL